jgi:glucose-6-phosphate 1-epimerase
MELTAANTGNTEFRFEEALHTYFRVGDVERVEVRGLAGIHYLDNMDGNRQKVQTGDIRLSASADNAYLNATGAIDMDDPVLGRVLRTGKENSATTIVWNPWREGAAKMADLGPDEWHQMICVEGGNILDAAVALSPGEQHTMRVTLSVKEP